MIPYDALRAIATPRQIEYIDALEQCDGSYRAAAKKLALNKDRVRQGLLPLFTRLEQSQHLHDIDGPAIRAAVKGWAPDYGLGQPLPPGFVARGYSTLRGPDGGVLVRWEKTKVDEQLRYEAILAGIREEAKNTVRLELLPPPKYCLKQLLNLYVFTDFHLGMRAWAEEGGAHWDLETAERLIIACFRQMIASAAPAATAFIAQLGDFMHFDGLIAKTPMSGHPVDAAAQYREIVRACIRILRALVDLALQKHDRVVILAAEGNHDLASSAWMAELLKVLYENEPRVEVVNNAAPFYAYEFGVNMLGFHHGHGVKLDALPLTFAAMFAQMWGRTTKRYGYAGHYHHELVKQEKSGMKMSQYPTLAPNDRHSTLHGYQSERQTGVETFHEKFGIVGSTVVTPEMVGC